MSNRKSIYFTSDWHIGHANVINFSNRPFKDLDHMHRVLINNYNAIVPPNGLCYFLGDVGLAGSDVLTKVFRKLNGTKVLIIGNHDGGVNSKYNVGFDVVLHGATMQIAGERVTLSHCPMRGKYRENTENMRGSQPGDLWHGVNKEKYKIFSIDEHEDFHLHGHIHSPNSGKSKKIEGKQYDVGVDANNYRPVSISEIESWISLYNKDRKI